MKKRNEETSKKMLFVVVGLSIGVPALARMIWKIWFLSVSYTHLTLPTNSRV